MVSADIVKKVMGRQGPSEQITKRINELRG